mgnify:FL=1
MSFNQPLTEQQKYDAAKALFNTVSFLASANDSDSESEEEDDYVTCENCGNYWDGFAQCSCLEISLTDDEEPEPEQEPTHKMTLRSDTKKQTQPTEHPSSWDQHSHYGQCGQSCPCCRTEVGDTWGACPICKHK